MAEFGPVLALLAVVGVALAGVHGFSALFAVRRPAVGITPFTGGLPPAEHAFSRFHVRWYPVTLVFLAFDMEMLFMYPWTLVVTRVGVSAVIEMFGFLAILFAGGALRLARRGPAVDLTASLLRFAAGRPHVLLVPVVGGAAARVAVEAELARRGWPTAAGPADADLLVTAGTPGPALGEVLEAVSTKVVCGRPGDGRGADG